MVSSLDSLKSALNGTINSTNTNKLKDNVDSSTKQIGALKKALNFGGVAYALKKGWNAISDIAKANIDMIETTNLFEVQMGKVVDQYGNLDEAQSQYYTRAMAFQDEMNEKLATNKSEMQKYQAMYYGMLNSQLGSKNRDVSYMMSESLTKAGYDIASLYNLDIGTAMNKLKSGLAGQIESLRQIGIDVSEASLTKVLDQVGIERSVQQLSYAEKEVARYIAIVEQAGKAQGDFARTFESPANQIRVFQNQLLELKQVAGSFIVNAFGGILVYVNAIIMVIKEIIKSLASLFGYNLDTGGVTSSFGGVADTIDDIDSGLGNATRKAKEFKKQLMGFDEINNIEPPTQNSKGSGPGGAVGGIDDKLLKSLKEWDNMMSKISGKAQEIRDKILDWLGFTRDANGNLKWSWSHMNNIAKVISVIAGIISGIYIIGKITKLVNWLKSLFTILKTGKGATTTFGLGLQTIGKVINGLKSGFTNIGAWVGMVIDQYKIFRSQGNGVISSLKLTGSALSTTGQGLSSFAKKAGTMVAGLAGIAGGSALSYATMKDFTTGTIGTTEAIAKLTAGLGLATASGVLAGSQFGTVGIIIGGIAGITTSVITTFMGYKDAIESLNIPTTKLTDEIKSLTEELNNNRKAHEDAVKSIKDTWENQLVEAEYAERLSKQLKGLVDANGKVKKGNEERVKFILNELNEALGTEYKLNGNLITKNGEVVKSYEDLQKSIKNTVEAKKKEAEQTAITELYKENIKEQIKLERDKAKAQEEFAKAEIEYNKLMSKGLSDWTLTHNENCKQIIQNYIDTADALNNTRDEYWKVTDDVSYYSQQMTDNIIENTGKLSTEMVTQQQVSAEKLQEMVTTSTETWQQTYDQLNTTQKSAMLAQSTILDNWSPTIQQKWADMANNSANDFLNGIAQVEPAVQSQILSSLTTTENLTPQMVTAWGNLSNKSFTEFSIALSKVEPNVQDKILKSITTTQGLTPVMQQAWSALASTSEERFNKALDPLDDDVKGQILASIIAVNGMDETNKRAYEKLSNKAKQAFNTAMNGMDTDAKNRVQSAINQINAQAPLGGQAGGNVGENIQSEFDRKTSNTETSAENFIKGFMGVLQLGNPLGILNVVGGFASKILSKFNQGLDEHSPSKATMKSAKYFVAGFSNQLNSLKSGSLKQVGELAEGLTNEFDNNLGIAKLGQGIKINTKDFAVDTNQYINYSAVKGQILAQSQVSMNDNIAERIAEAVTQSMRNAEVNVNIEARTDEGVIFKKVQNSAREYTMQTGEPAFGY